MRISDWSSDVCSSDLIQVDRHKRFWRDQGDGTIYPRLWPAARHDREGEGWCRKMRSYDQDPAFRLQPIWRPSWRLRLWTAMPSETPYVLSPAEGFSGMLRHSRERRRACRSEEHTSELQSLMRISYAVFCLKKKTNTYQERDKYYME